MQVCQPWLEAVYRILGHVAGSQVVAEESTIPSYWELDL